MKLITINSSGCGDPSNIAFYWLPGGCIHMAWIPPNSPSAAPQGGLLQLEGSLGQAAGGKMSTGALLEHMSIPWTETEASYCCVVQPGFGSAGQVRVVSFFPQQVIFIKFTILIFFSEMSYFFHMFVKQGRAEVRRDQHQRLFSFNNYVWQLLKHRL